MRTWFPRTLAAVLIALLAASCGGGGQNRPFVVGSWPTAADGIDGPLPYVRIDYNEPVSVLNPSDFRLTVDGIGFGGVVQQFADDPDSVYVFPANRQGFPADSTISVAVIQGLVINGLEHYAAEPVVFTAESGAEASLPVGELGAVSLVNTTDGTTEETVVAPGAHDPVAVVSTTRATTRRIWVQFDTAGGVGTSLAWFAPGDGSMTPVALTSTGELTTPAGAMVVGPRGRELFAAFRDAGTDAISVHRIDTATGLESGVIVIEGQAPAASAVPRGLALGTGARPPTLHLTTEDATSGTVTRIDRATFTEIDQDPATIGVQGIALPDGAGPCVSIDVRTIVAIDSGSDVTRVEGSPVATTLPGAVAGTNTAIARSPDEELVLQGLTGFSGAEMLQDRRRGLNFQAPTPIEVSDDVGGTSTGATAVVGIVLQASSEGFLVILDTPTGAVLTTWTYLGLGRIEQVDLDAATAGVQGLLLTASPIVVGTNHGPYAD